MDLDKFQIDGKSSIGQALKVIEVNHHGIVFISVDGTIEGSVTDGDIRRALLNGASLSDNIAICANKDFIWSSSNASRENQIKQLDHNIRVLPVLDEFKKLVGIFSRDHIPILAEEEVYARSRAPVRISFGGGGSDLTHFFWEQNGAVINATISLYSHATLKLRSDSAIYIESADLGESLQAPSLPELLQHNGRFGLIQAVMKLIKPQFGFELYLNSDFPIGSGLGGSAVVASAILGCFNEFRRDKWNVHELAELAFQAERFNLDISGGWQDQYASIFGGFNFMEFNKEQNIVHPIRLRDDIVRELEESLILCNTGSVHNSGSIHDDQRVTMGSDDVKEKVKQNVELTYQIRNHLLRGNLSDIGKCLHKAWMLKRGFGSQITNSGLDEIYNFALENGAIGGKLLGAGGGGFFLFYATPFIKNKLIDALKKKNLLVQPFRFDQNGMSAWTVRQKINSI
jgi:D-glycero-alpha-D-manno-heptose-7-phosphate kinase